MLKIKLLLLLIPIFFSIGGTHHDGSRAQSNDGTSVTHIPQFHFVKGLGTNKKFMDDVAKCQHAIATALLKAKDSAVFLEALTEDLTPEVYEKLSQEPMSMVGAAKMIFPNGFPSNLAELTPLQKDFLAENGATRTLFYLNLLKHVYRTLDPEESKKIDDEIQERAKKFGGQIHLAMDLDPEIKRFIFEKRENAAVKKIDAYSATPANKGKKILLVFGGAHDFSGYFPAEKSIPFHQMSNLPPQCFKKDEPKAPHEIFQRPHQDMNIPKYESFNGNYSEALLRYGNHPAKKEKLDDLVREETKILEDLERRAAKGEKYPLQAWQWQHLLTPQLKKRAIPLLDPKSINEYFPVKAFQKRIEVEPSLKQAGEEWLKLHSL